MLFKNDSWRVTRSLIKSKASKNGVSGVPPQKFSTKLRSDWVRWVIVNFGSLSYQNSNHSTAVSFIGQSLAQERYLTGLWRGVYQVCNRWAKIIAKYKLLQENALIKPH